MGYKIKHKIYHQNIFSTWKNKISYWIYKIFDLHLMVTKCVFHVSHLGTFRLFQGLCLLFFFIL